VEAKIFDGVLQLAMEWDSDSDSSSESGNTGQCTPQDGVSLIDVDDLASALTEMSGLHNTPMPKRSSRLHSESRGRVLFPKQEVKLRWSHKEDYALTLFLLFHADGKTWVIRKDEKFWDAVGIFVQGYSQSTHRHTG